VDPVPENPVPENPVPENPVPDDPVAVAVAHCPSCGRLSAACPGCGRDLDPPRFCTRCGTRLAVRVTPAGFVGRCKHHGEVARS
jgi:hypothetical protein